LSDEDEIISIALDNVDCKISGPIPSEVVTLLDEATSYEHPGYKYMQGGRGGYGAGGNRGGWDGKVRLMTKYGKCHIGLLSIVKNILNENNLKYEITDNRPKINYGNPIPTLKGVFEPRDYQEKALESAIKAGSGIIKSATGSGKSKILASIAANYNIPTVIYVIGIELLYQMKDTMKDAYGIECGIVGGGKCDVSKKVTIMTIWSAAAAFNKKVKVIDNDTTQDSSKHIKSLNKQKVRAAVEGAQLFIFDECQYAASETLQFLHKASVSARHRFLLSGTPWRDGGDDILIEAVGGPKIVDISATKLIKEEYLVPPDIHFLNVPTMRKVGKTYHEVYKNYIVENEERNDLIIKAAKNLVENGRKVLILVVRVGHGKLLLEKLEADYKVKFLDGARSAKDRMDAIQEMKDGKLDLLIASKIFDQGVDIPSLDALILAGSGKSSGRALQRIGRVIRKNDGKKKAIVVEFFDNCKYLRDHSEARIKVYQSEPGFNIIMSRNIPLKSYPERKTIEWV
jgi:superfamily II DNA or RNA helicase